jgi:hypothetical protein
MITGHKFSSRRASAVLGLGVALAIGSGLAIDAAGASAQSVEVQQEESQNWNGYVVASNSGNSFSSVSGSWVQPSVSSNGTAGDGYSAFWVGLGGSGQSSQSLEQVGTAADVQNGQVTYYAWYELVPSPEQRLNLAIHPGDHMSGKVTVDGSSVTISLSDQSTGQSTTKTLQMSSPDTSSAEWIAEAPATQTEAGNAVLPLADFGSVSFTNASATAGQVSGSIADPEGTVRQVGTSSATAGALSSDGSSFTVSYSGDGGSGQTGTGSRDATGGYPGGSYGDPSDGGSGYGDPGYDGGYVDPGYGGGYADPGYGGGYAAG